MRDFSTGIRNCRYIVRGTVITVKPMPGAIKLSFKPSSADRTMLVRHRGGGAAQYTSARRTQEKRAELEIVSLPESFLTDVLGWVKNPDESLTEGIKPDVRISLLYETINGGRPVRHQLYNCLVSEPNFDATTFEDLGVDTRKLELIINPDPGSGNSYSRQIARADNTVLFDTWFGLVQT